METEGLGKEELKLVLEKAEKALDGCLDATQVIENKIAALLRINILVALFTVGLLITEFDENSFAISILTLFIGSAVAAFFLLTATRPAEMAVPGSAWSDFEEYKDDYGENEEGFLRYLIDVCLGKIEVVRKDNNSRAGNLDLALRINLYFIITSAVVSLFIYLIDHM